MVVIVTIGFNEENCHGLHQHLVGIGFDRDEGEYKLTIRCQQFAELAFREEVFSKLKTITGLIGWFNPNYIDRFEVKYLHRNGGANYYFPWRDFNSLINFVDNDITNDLPKESKDQKFNR